ncbi:DNA-binding transcriptional response regulator [Roseivivax sediminis]|uniref:Response regulator receiver domain-containing protein n=1 Tax=Roseivivax sediminis TaxID=936889 RepID=A0A1I2AY28_9RHOB|nr:response regulator [Roseivivax sediminis]SFE48726.1 Response regulator receiver domain-containing protein [Roseivivax sediminis]
MRVLIVESRKELGTLWRNALARGGAEVWLAHGQNDAAGLIHRTEFDVIVLDVVLDEGSALAVADLASYRQPICRVVFVTDTTFFSDGTIFNYCANAAAYVPASTAPDDLAALVEHHATVKRP